MIPSKLNRDEKKEKHLKTDNDMPWNIGLHSNEVHIKGKKLEKTDS